MSNAWRQENTLRDSPAGKHRASGLLHAKDPRRRTQNHDSAKLATKRQVILRPRQEQATASPLITIVSSSPTHLLAKQLISALRDAKLDESWPRLVPSRLGHNKSVDLAATALSNAQDYATTNIPGFAARTMPSYVGALASLRTDLAQPHGLRSDDTVITVALLTLVERHLAPAGLPLYSHMAGLNLLLSGRSSAQLDNASEVIRGVMYEYWSLTFLRPSVLGIASPFDHPKWYMLEPLTQERDGDAVATLGQIANELFIRLPRLIVLLRQIRQGMPQTAQAVRLATELAQRKDTEAEGKLLHNVKVRRTLDSSTQVVVPYSLDFDTKSTYRAAIYYWLAQLTLARLCNKLNTILPNVPVTVPTLEEIQRILKNVLMTWQYTSQAGTIGSAVTSLSLLTSWAMIADSPAYYQGTVETPALKQWLLDKMNETLRGWQTTNAREMNLLADLYIGGPIEGEIVERMRMAWAYKEINT